MLQGSCHQRGTSVPGKLTRSNFYREQTAKDKHRYRPARIVITNERLMVLEITHQFSIYQNKRLATQPIFLLRCTEAPDPQEKFC